MEVESRQLHVLQTKCDWMVPPMITALSRLNVFTILCDHSRTGTMHIISCSVSTIYTINIMTSSNRNIFRVTGPFWGATCGFPSQRPVTQGFGVSFDLHLNKRLRKQWGRQWFETPSRSLWRQCKEDIDIILWLHTETLILGYITGNRAICHFSKWDVMCVSCRN